MAKTLIDTSEVSKLFKDAVIGSLRRLAFEEEISFVDEPVLGKILIVDSYLKQGLQALYLQPKTAILCLVRCDDKFVDSVKYFFGKDGVLKNENLVVFVLEDIVAPVKNALLSLDNLRVASKKHYIKLIQTFPDLWEPLRSLDNAFISKIPAYIKEALPSKSDPGRYGENAKQLRKDIGKVKKLKGEKKISMILGNGVSIPFGSDSWTKMTDNLTDYLTPLYVDNLEKVRNTIGYNLYASTSLAQYMLLKYDKDKYVDALYYNIYRKYNKKRHQPGTLIRAISEIILKCSDSLEIGTFNYDSFLENDLSILNKDFKVKAVYNKDPVEENDHFKVFHLHGHLPSDLREATEEEKEKYLKSIVLTQKDYLEQYSNKDSFAFGKQKELYENEVCLFVGSSMTDVFQLECMNQLVGKKFYAILPFKDLTPKDLRNLRHFYATQGITVIPVKEYSEINGLLEYLFNVKITQPQPESSDGDI